MSQVRLTLISLALMTKPVGTSGFPSLLIIDRHPYEINREKKEQSINVSVRLVHAGTCFYAYAPLC